MTTIDAVAIIREDEAGVWRIVEQGTGRTMHPGSFRQSEQEDALRVCGEINTRLRAARRDAAEAAQGTLIELEPEAWTPFSDQDRREGETLEDYQIRRRFREAEANTPLLFGVSA